MDGMGKHSAKLRRGYTTGSCAAAAAKAAALVLLGGESVSAVELDTPGGQRLTLTVAETHRGEDSVCCAVRKDGGDDPDVTHGLLICAEVSLCASSVTIEGGEGVGRVTQPGLDQPVGAAAINSVPRQMIARAVREAGESWDYAGGFRVLLTIPGGAAVAQKTFNGRMGIEGGLSILGTTGIVEPMSHTALAETIRLEIRQRAALGQKRLLLTPGNYGETFASGGLQLSLTQHVNCANFLGAALDACVEHGVTEILLVGHIGKLVKVGLGMMNTHSAWGDGRMETLVACALEAGAEVPLLRGILSCVTTDAALMLLREAGLLEQTMTKLGARIDRALVHRVGPDGTIGFVCFTKAEGLAGVLCRSANAEELMKHWRKST